MPLRLSFTSCGIDEPIARGLSLKFLSNKWPVILSEAYFSGVEGPAFWGVCDSRLRLKPTLRTSGAGHKRQVRMPLNHGILRIVMATEKTFYLETFGCQMNAHDSEKVIGTLLHEGYRQVETEEEAGLILYNTCSIRDKAEQKVFNRLNDYKKLHKSGKRFGVLGCVAQQEGEKIFE